MAAATVTTLAGTAHRPGSADGSGAAAQFSYPSGLSADSAGNLYVADTGNATVRKIGLDRRFGQLDLTERPVNLLPVVGVAEMADRDARSSGRNDDHGRKIVLASGAVTTLVGIAGQLGVKLGALPAGLNSRVALAALSNGELLVVDSQELAVLAVR